MRSPAERQAECLQRAERLLALLRDHNPEDFGEGFWYGVAAVARQIERRAAEQYKAAEVA